MAIKVNGTTVIDDSRNLANVGGLKTVNGTSLVGSGNISAGASTTFGAVGTYVEALYYGSNISRGSSVAASTLRRSDARQLYEMIDMEVLTSSASTFASGTWRYMGHKHLGNYLSGSNIYMPPGIFVRIS